MLKNPTKEIKDNIKVLGKKAKIIIACSGGVDSMTLLSVLQKLVKKERIIVAHLNHLIRNDSDKTIKLIRDYCNKYALLLEEKALDIKKISKTKKLGLEECGRLYRYSFFQDLAKKHNAKFILTAHNKDDLAETIFLNLIRGTFIQGLIGIKTLNNNILRPMLSLSKEEIIKYAKAHKINWHEDYTNEDTMFSRNFLRHLILKQIKTRFPGFLDNIYKFRTRIIDIADYLRGEVKDFLKDDFSKFDIDSFVNKPNFLRKDILKELFSHHNKSQKDLTDDYLEELVSFVINAKNSGVKEFGKLKLLVKSYGQIIVRDYKESKIDRKEKIILEIPGEILFNEMGIKAEIKKRKIVDIKNSESNFCYLDKDKVGDKVRIETFGAGDYFIPFGMSGKKKLSDLFTDQKIPVHLRRKLPIFKTMSNDIIWVGGIRIDDRFKITDKTQNILKLTINNL